MPTQSEINSTCCPKFNPVLWDDKILEWDHKKFIRDHIRTFFYMPLNFGGVMKRIMDKVEKAGAKTPDFLCLSAHASKWKMDIYLEVSKDVPDADNISMSGKFYCKVYEGPFGNTGKWCKDYEGITIAKGYKIKKQYMWYTTCPKCAKKYGKNYVAIIGQIE
jgi:hypothetical protein